MKPFSQVAQECAEVPAQDHVQTEWEAFVARKLDEESVSPEEATRKYQQHSVEVARAENATYSADNKKNRDFHRRQMKKYGAIIAAAKDTK